MLETTGINPAHITFELTESAFMHDQERAQSRVRSLKRVGVKIAMDDFGTGMSSLSRLKHTPVDTVKIDRGFRDRSRP